MPVVSNLSDFWRKLLCCCWQLRPIEFLIASVNHVSGVPTRLVLPTDFLASESVWQRRHVMSTDFIRLANGESIHSIWNPFEPPMTEWLPSWRSAIDFYNLTSRLVVPPINQTQFNWGPAATSTTGPMNMIRPITWIFQWGGNGRLLPAVTRNNTKSTRLSLKSEEKRERNTSTLSVCFINMNCWRDLLYMLQRRPMSAASGSMRLINTIQWMAVVAIFFIYQSQ